MNNLSESDATLVAAEISNDPANIGYAGKTPEEIAALLCQQTEIDNPTPATYEADHTLYTWRQIYAAIGTAKGYAVKQSLTSMVEQVPYLSDILAMLETYTEGGGISFGSDDFRGMVDMLAGGGIITSEEGETIKAIGRKQVVGYQPRVMQPCRLTIITSGRNNGSITADEITELM